MQHAQHKAAPAATPTPAVRVADTPAQYPVEARALLRLPQVLALVAVSKTTWWKLVREGRAPQPVKLGDRCTAWRATDIAAWIESAGQPESQA